MKIGVIGTARIAKKSVIPGMMGVKEIIPYAIAGRKKEKVEAFKEAYGFQKGYDSYDQLLEDQQLEAVYIPLPNGMHYEMVKKALSKGLHVICEKPLATSKEEVEDLFALAEKKGLVLQEAFAYRLSQIHQIVLEKIKNGSIGKLKYIQAHFTFPMSDSSNVRLSRELFGGATYDVGCYNVNLIRYLAQSEPIQILASGKVDTELKVDTESTAILTFENGVTGISHCSFDESFSNEYKIMGTDGRISIPLAFNAQGKVELLFESGSDVNKETYDITDNYQLEMKHFYDCVKGKTKQIVNKEDSVANAAVIDQILEQIGY